MVREEFKGHNIYLQIIGRQLHKQVFNEIYKRLAKSKHHYDAAFSALRPLDLLVDIDIFADSLIVSAISLPSCHMEIAGSTVHTLCSIK